MESIENILQFMSQYKEAFLLIGAFIAGIGMIIKFLYPIFKEKKDKQVEHDTKIFNLSNNLLSEEQCKELIENLKADHSIDSNAIVKVEKFELFFEQQGNHYLNHTLEKSTLILLKNLKKLQSFLQVNFDTFPKIQHNDNIKYCMYPEGNIDRNWNGSKESLENYETQLKELEKLCKEVRNSYKKYRLSIKNIIKA